MGPHPLLLDSDVCDADINHPGRLKHHVTVQEEVLEGGGGGGDTEDATGFHAPDPLDPGAADTRAIEGSVDLGCDILRIVWAELEPRIMGELEGSIVHGCHCGGGGFLGVRLSLDYLPALRGRRGSN